MAGLTPSNPLYFARDEFRKSLPRDALYGILLKVGVKCLSLGGYRLKSAFCEIFAITFFIVLPAVSSDKEPDLSQQCVHALVTVAKSAAPTLTSLGDRIHIGSKEVRLKAQIENEERADTKFLIGMHVDVFVDGVLQPLTFGSVGVGSNRDDAVETAASEWAMAVGEALLGALGVGIGEKPQSVGPFLVYQGLTGIRGSHRVIWSAEKNRQLLHHLDTFVQGLEHSPGELHSISLMVLVRPDGTTQGECRVDGAVSPAVLKALQSFPWDQSGTEYVFKQFYVLRRR